MQKKKKQKNEVSVYHPKLGNIVLGKPIEDVVLTRKDKLNANTVFAKYSGACAESAVKFIGQYFDDDDSERRSEAQAMMRSMLPYMAQKQASLNIHETVPQGTISGDTVGAIKQILDAEYEVE